MHVKLYVCNNKAKQNVCHNKFDLYTRVSFLRFGTDVPLHVWIVTCMFVVYMCTHVYTCSALTCIYLSSHGMHFLPCICGSKCHETPYEGALERTLRGKSQWDSQEREARARTSA